MHVWKQEFVAGTTFVVDNTTHNSIHKLNILVPNWQILSKYINYGNQILNEKMKKSPFKEEILKPLAFDPPIINSHYIL